MGNIVHLLRHGEVYNPTGLLYGREPGFYLSALGEAQAKAVADSFAHRDITHIVTSPLERARQTALPLIAYPYPFNAVVPPSVEIDERVIETGNLFSGMRLSANSTGLVKRPSLWRRLYNPFNPSWGENYTDMAARVLSAVQDARKAAGSGEAIVVSHQLPIWATRLFLEGRPGFHDPSSRQCSLCSVTTLRFDGDDVVRIEYAEPAAAVVLEEVVNG